MQKLITANSENHIIVFGKSGCGKTRLLMALLARRYGWFLVCRGSSGKNLGSTDVAAVTEAIQRQIGLGRSTECRNIVVYVKPCILVARALVLDAWTKVKGKPTPEQWLWAQLHPDLLIPRIDIFTELAVKLFEHDTFFFQVA